MLGNILHAFLSSADFFQNQLFRKILSGIRSVSNSFDSDQARYFVWHDLGPNCLQMLSADSTSRQRVKKCFVILLQKHSQALQISKCLVKADLIFFFCYGYFQTL